jgi:integrase
MSKMASYLQYQTDKGLWRYRRPVPPECQAVLGKKIILQALGTRSEPEAKKLAVPLILRDSQLFADIASGDYPSLQDEAVEMIAYRWMQQASFPDYLPGENPSGAGFADQDALERSLRAFLVQNHPAIRLDGKAYPRILREAVQQHHEVFKDFTIAQQRRDDLTDRLRIELAARQHQPESVLAALAPRQTPIALQPQQDALREESALPIKGVVLDEFLRLFKFIDADGEDTKTCGDYRRTFDRFEKEIGIKSVRDVSTMDIEKFYQCLLKTPADRGTREFIAPATVERSISNLRKFFSWAVSRHLTSDNPLRKLVIEQPNEDDDDDEASRNPFTKAELTKIFEAPLYRGCFSKNRVYKPGTVRVFDQRYWFPLIALFSGMRVMEIAMLEFQDIFDLNGRRHFSVNRKSMFGNKKKTKTKSSIRQVPIHPKLIELGLLEYIEERRKVSKNGRVFPSYRYSNFFNQEFLVKINIKAPDKTFHSFRHNFRDALRPLGQEEGMARLMGHFREGTGAHYGSRDLLQYESDMIDGVAYPGLDLSGIGAP